jgi:hypothetical protein
MINTEFIENLGLISAMGKTMEETKISVDTNIKRNFAKIANATNNHFYLIMRTILLGDII